MPESAESPTSVTCDLLPYMEAYYDAKNNPPCWLPGVMALTAALQRSEVVNTDAHGFRHSSGPEGETVTVEKNHATIRNLIAGGSCGFGVGASGDSGTLASRLAGLGGETWANFCVRAHTVQQQLTQFTFFMPRLSSLRRIVLFCGLNEIEAFHRCVLMPRIYGPFFAWNRYFQLMNSHMVDRKTKTYTGPEGGHLIRIDDHDREWKPYAEVLENALGAWATIARACGADLYFFFQPIPGFMSRKPAAEEQRIYDHMARVAPDTFDIRTKQNLNAYRNWYREALESSCVKHGIPYFDLNRVLDDGRFDGHWLFVDTSHLTDYGHEVCAGEMHRLMSSR